MNLDSCYFITILYSNGYLETFDFATEQGARDFAAEKLKVMRLPGEEKISAISFGERS